MDKLDTNKILLTHLGKGCIETHWRGSPEDLAKIKALHQEGLLAEILGVSVLDVRVIPSNYRPINLSNWLQETLINGWQTLEQLLTSNQLQPALRVENSETQLAKKIDLGLKINQQQVAVIINIKRINEQEADILVQVIPINNNFLPPQLKLIINLESDSAEVEARTTDNAIQLGFVETVGKTFTIELILEDAVMTENFIV